MEVKCPWCGRLVVVGKGVRVERPSGEIKICYVCASRVLEESIENQKVENSIQALSVPVEFN